MSTRSTNPRRTARRMATKATPQHPRVVKLPWRSVLFGGALVAFFVVFVWWHDQTPPVASQVAALPSSASISGVLPVGRNTPIRRTQIGIIAGHNRLKTLPNGDVIRDDNPNYVPDPGAVCEDGSAI
ncbi:MAG: hypothetical protein LC737_07305, partial [Chloroflexi bacterium]|nr:hypothetical protein [Chloroflexota bacterium]